MDEWIGLRKKEDNSFYWIDGSATGFLNIAYQKSCEAIVEKTAANAFSSDFSYDLKPVRQA